MNTFNLLKINAILGLLLLVLAMLVAGCSSQDDDPAHQQSAGMIDASTTGTTAALGDSIAGDGNAADTDFVACSMCGMKVLRSEAVFVDGKLLCAHCVPGAHGESTKDQDASSEEKSPSQ